MGSEPRDAKKKLNELDEPGGPSSGRRVDYPPAPSKVRERMATVTDEFALEQARLQSFPSNYPPRPLTATMPAGPMLEQLRDESAGFVSGEAEIEGKSAGEQVAILRGRLHPLTRVPELAKPMADLGELLDEPKTAYVLGFIDGILPLETIIESNGLPEIDTLRVLDRMVATGIVIIRTR